MSACRNCGAALHGRFCHACGQKAVASEVSVHDLVHEGIEEFAHVDGKIARTLKLLVRRPGALTREFLDGRRVRYISPIRLYLTCSLLFFALSAWAPASENTHFRITQTDVNSDEERKVAERVLESFHSLRERITHNAPRAMFVLMPVFGLFTWVCYRRAQPFYVSHLYYAIHFHAFVFLMLAIDEAFSLGGRIGQAVGGLVPLTILPYHYLALRRVFGGTRWQLARKGTLIGATYALTIGGIFAVLLVITVRNAIGK